MQKELNIVSFDVPYPANYGGAIDLFYKLKALSKLGIKIYYHTFEYGRGEQQELEKYADKVFYYKRDISKKHLFSFKPYIVKSRESEELLTNLLSNNAPIIFEGLHSCAYLSHPKLKERTKIVRTHNIEHKYYYSLAKKRGNIKNRLFFLLESLKLKLYEPILENSDILLPISIKDKEYLKKYNVDSQLITPFHGNNNFNNIEGKGDYVLFHGNLSVKENSEIALFLIDNVFNRLDKKLIVAGLNPTKQLIKRAKLLKNCQLIENPTNDEMNSLISNAHIIALFTNQTTGIKLKLIESLYNGRFCLCNHKMIYGTGLTEKSVIICNKMRYKHISKVIIELLEKDFTKKHIEKRKQEVEQKFNDETNAEIIYNLL